MDWVNHILGLVIYYFWLLWSLHHQFFLYTSSSINMMQKWDIFQQRIILKIIKNHGSKSSKSQNHQQRKKIAAVIGRSFSKWGDQQWHDCGKRAMEISGMARVRWELEVQERKRESEVRVRLERKRESEVKERKKK